MENNDIKVNQKTVTSNLFWRFMERTGAQGVTFIVGIVLARLLEPEMYGTVALITVFTGILQVFVDSGMGNALIQKKDADDLDFSSVFYFYVVMCSVLYLGMFFAAPLIAKFYERPELTPVIRVMSLILIISGVKHIQQTYVSKHLLFKKFFYSTLGGTVCAAVVGIWMAYKGYGVWAIVVQNLVNQTMDTVILWITVKWRPKKCFSFKRLKGLFSYGWKILVSTLIDKVYADIRQLIIGKMYSAESLAFYNKGKTFPSMIVTNINTSIDSVLLPSLSAKQDDKERVRAMTRRSMRISTYIMAPIMMGFAFIATPVIRFVLTPKWLPCVPFLRIFCITLMFYPIHTANLSAVKAMGRSDLFLILEILKKAVGLTALLSTMWFGVMAMAYSLLFTSVASQIINAWPNKKLLNYGYLDQLKDILPNILLAVFMGACVSFVSYLGLSDIVTLIIQVPLGVIIYLAGSKLFKLDSLDYILNIAKGYLTRRKSRA